MLLRHSLPARCTQQNQNGCAAKFSSFFFRAGYSKQNKGLPALLVLQRGGIQYHPIPPLRSSSGEKRFLFFLIEDEISVWRNNTSRLKKKGKHLSRVSSSSLCSFTAFSIDKRRQHSSWKKKRQVRRVISDCVARLRKTALTGYQSDR